MKKAVKFESPSLNKYSSAESRQRAKSAHREKLMDIQKREQLKGMLSNKLKLKFGETVNHVIDAELRHLFAKDRLTAGNLKSLNDKVQKEFDINKMVVGQKRSQTATKHSIQEI